MPIVDPYKALIQRQQLAIAVESLMRKEAVVNFYAARGKKVVSSDDQQTRRLLKMGAGEKAADERIELGSGQL